MPVHPQLDEEAGSGQGLFAQYWHGQQQVCTQQQQLWLQLQLSSSSSSSTKTGTLM